MPYQKLILLSLLLSLLFFPRQALAVTTVCQQATAAVDSDNNTWVSINTKTQASPNGFIDGGKFQIMTQGTSGQDGQKADGTSEKGVITFKLGKMTPGTYSYALFYFVRPEDDKSAALMCNGSRDGASFVVPDNGQGGTITQCTNSSGKMQIDSNPKTGVPINVTVNNLQEDGTYCVGVVEADRIKDASNQSKCTDSKDKALKITLDPLPAGKWWVGVGKQGSKEMVDCAIVTTSVPATNANAVPVTPTPPCIKRTDPNFNPDTDAKRVCSDAGGTPCWTSNGQIALGTGDGVMTALGCVPTEPTAFISGLFKFTLGIGGAVALLLMIVGSFQMITSQGNPDTVKAGREQFTNAIIGLLFIIFSVLLLQIIGFNILNIPGFKP